MELTRLFQSQRRPLRSKAGCLTCLKRRKKCDEEEPVCGDCRRLGIRCVQRKSAASASNKTALSMTSLRVRPCHIVVPPDSGYLAFADTTEKAFTIRCATQLRAFVSAMAGSSFQDLSFFVTASLQNRLVRSAAVAFAAAFSGDDEAGTFVTCIRNYQACIRNLSNALSAGPKSSAERQELLICCMLLGLLEVGHSCLGIRSGILIT